jgi:hypothetical protein
LVIIVLSLPKVFQRSRRELCKIIIGLIMLSSIATLHHNYLLFTMDKTWSWSLVWGHHFVA